MIFSPDKLQITDWSLEGRQRYIKKNRDTVKLVIEYALEEFSGEAAISKAFRSQELASEGIIKRFLVPELDPKKVPSDNIILFSNIEFWIKHKTQGRASTKSYTLTETEHIDECDISSELEQHRVLLAKNLLDFNKAVDPDLTGFWMQANKKLIDNLALSAPLNSIFGHSEFDGSPTKFTRYKADACFRFLYVHLKFKNLLSDDSSSGLYERKYFTRGSNKPQYTYDGYEGHVEKDKIRRFIMRIIDLFLEHHPNSSILDQCLFRTMAKKTLIEHYEINGQPRQIYKDKIYKLRSLQSSEELAS